MSREPSESIALEPPRHGGSATASPPRADSGLVGLDALVALALFLCLLALYGATQQERMHGDGPGLAGFHVLPETAAGYNQFYLACARALGRLLPHGPGDDPILAVRWLSAVAGAVGGAATYLVARGFDARRGASLFAALLTAFAPAVWFYSTSIEVHALHYAMVAVGAALLLYAPWQHPWLGTLIACCVLPLVFFSHLSGAFLGPGCLVLILWAAARPRGSSPGTPLRPATFWGLVVPALSLTLLGCVLLRARLRYGEWMLWDELVFAQVAVHDNEHFTRRMLVEGWLFPLLWLVPGALAGLVALRRERLRCAALATLILPSTIYFLWWGLPERGGYALGTAAFYGAATALALRLPPFCQLSRLAGFAAATALLAAQGGAALVGVRGYDRGFRPLERVAVLAELLPPGGRAAGGASGEVPAGTVVSFRELTPRIEVYRRDVREVYGTPAMSQYALAGLPPEEFGDTTLPLFESLLAAGPVVVDVSYRGLADLPVVRARLPYLVPLEAALHEHFALHEVERGDWSFLVLESVR